MVLFSTILSVTAYAEKVIGSRAGNILVERYFNDLPEGKKGPWVVEILKDTNPQEFLVRGTNLVPDLVGLLGGETGWGGLSEPSDFSSSSLSSFNRCKKPDGAVFYLDKAYTCSGDPTPKDPPKNPNDEKIGSRAGNDLVARYFTDLPEGKKGPWVVEIISNSDPQEFLVRGANLVPDREGLLGGETSWGGLSQPTLFPESQIAQSYNRCSKPDGAIFYLNKSNACPGEKLPPGDEDKAPDAPTISSSPSPAFSGGLVSFSAKGCNKEINWYKNGQFVESGMAFSIPSAVQNDSYSAKCKSVSLESGFSNQISIQAKVPDSDGSVRITEPNKPPYYYSNNRPPSHYDNKANLPLIIKNQPRYSNEEMVYLENNKIKIGINLKRGGQIAWASLIDGTENLVYNGYDGGFQITLDAYQRKDGYTQQGEVAGSGIPGKPTFSYNVTHGGDFQNNAATLIDYHPIPNGYYVKLRPIHYPLTAKMSETYIESTYVLEGRSLKITYKYTSFRTDGQYDGGGFDGGGVPACFIVNKLTHFKTYSGNAPWTRAPIVNDRLPIINEPYNQPIKGIDSTEYWGMVYDPARPNSGIGVFNNVDGGKNTHFHFKQLEVYPGNGPGDEFTGGFTFFQANSSFNIQDRSNYSKEMTVYLMIGSESEIRDEAYKHAGH